MRRIITLFAAAALALGMASAAAAACKDPATGKFVACPAAATTPTAAAGYSLDAKGKCRDAKGKMAKKAMCAGSTAAATTPMSAHAGSMAASTTPMSAHATGGAMSSMSKMSATSSESGPACKKGKRCGNACISVNDVCHKP